MAQTEQSTGPGNTAVPHGGDHDRVAMLSLKQDGTPDQSNPEIIGDYDVALDAAKRQFREQAVSAVDVEERTVVPEDEVDQKQDPQIEALKKKHDAAAKAGEQAAEKAVKKLSDSK